MLENILGNKTGWKILRLMVEAPGRPISQKEIRNLIKLGFSNLQDSLNKLVYSDIVNKKKQGRITYYYLNLTNNLTQEIINLIDLERKKLNNLQPSKSAILAEFERKLIDEIGGIKKVILFGSVAKRISIKGSDIDVCILTEDKLSKKEKLRLTKIITHFENKGNKFQIFDFTEKEFEKMLREKAELAIEIARDGINLNLIS